MPTAGIASATATAATTDPVVSFENFTDFLLCVSGMCFPHTSLSFAIHVLIANDLEFCTYAGQSLVKDQDVSRSFSSSQTIEGKIKTL